jgi:hypothetical protein
MIDLESKFGLIVKEHFDYEHFVCLTTVDAKGMPQPRPVWFIWEASFDPDTPPAHKFLPTLQSTKPGLKK